MNRPQTSWRRAAGALLAAGALILSGCGTSQQHDYLLDLAPTSGALAIDVENFRGDVLIRADQKTAGVRVLGDVTVSEQETKEARDEALKAVHVSAELEEHGARSVLKVRSTTDRPDKDDHRVVLQIDVPRCDGVRVDNHGGVVNVVNTGGAFEIFNRAGWVEIRTAQVIVDPITVTNVDGPVYIKLPTGSKGAFDLESLTGEVIVVDRAGASGSVRGRPHTHVAKVNGGENPVVVRTNRGEVRVWIDDNPMAMSQLVHFPVVDPEDWMFLKGSRRHTRNLPDDHPEVRQMPKTFNDSYHD